MNIAIIGAGEVGRTYAEAVAEQSVHTAIVCDPYPNDKTLRFVSEVGLELHRQAGTWLADIDRVWLCVTGDLALPACRDLLSYLRPATVIVDLTTAAPGDKQTAFHLAAEHRIQYVDAVILGAIALTGAATPLVAAGPAGEEAMRDFAGLGAPIRVLPQARAGDAAALKLLRTILTKGLEALAVECLVAAEKQGIRTELYDAMSDVDAGRFYQLPRHAGAHPLRRGGRSPAGTSAGIGANGSPRSEPLPASCCGGRHVRPGHGT